MISQQRLQTALGRLIGWLETWCTAEGAYQGFVIHRTEQKRMGAIHDTAWTQAAMIRGYAHLLRRSEEPRWREALALAADLQASRFEEETGKYRYAGHEDDRFCSLVHCALANCALLTACDLVDAERRRRYLEVVRQNVDRYWMPHLWVEEEGVFRFSEVDHYSPHEHRFVVNFNCMAAEGLIGLTEVTGIPGYRATAMRIGRWLIQRCEHARRQQAELLAGKPVDEGWMPPGGLPYQYTPSQRDPDNYVALYAGLSLRGIAALYRTSGEEPYARILRETCDFLLAMRDPRTRLFYHTARRGRIEPYPQFVAGAGMILSGLALAGEALGEPVEVETTVEAVLSRVLANGAFPSFVGKNRSAARGGRGVVWEDLAAAVNWNAQWFEYLARCAENPAETAVREPGSTARSVTRRFFYADSPRQVAIVSWWPPRSAGLYWMKKTSARAWLSFSPRTLYAKCRAVHFRRQSR